MKLLALRCPQCVHDLTPGDRDVVVQCPNCHSAVGLDDGGLTIIDAAYAAPASTATNWVPFWRFEGRVIINEREVQNKKLSLTGWVSARDSQAFWSTASQYYVPAWDLPLEQASEMARDLLESQPQLTKVDRPTAAQFSPAIFSPDDARKLLELIIVTVEARRSDWLKELDFTMEMAKPVLWIVPARQNGSKWQLIAEDKRR